MLALAAELAARSEMIGEKAGSGDESVSRSEKGAEICCSEERLSRGRYLLSRWIAVSSVLWPSCRKQSSAEAVICTSEWWTAIGSVQWPAVECRDLLNVDIGL
ncbi:UNVERIFIED_CONTAM: hypothetical protein FKN15_059587 [Acipenser sinensis]